METKTWYEIETLNDIGTYHSVGYSFNSEDSAERNLLADLNDGMIEEKQAPRIVKVTVTRDVTHTLEPSTPAKIVSTSAKCANCGESRENVAKWNEDNTLPKMACCGNTTSEAWNGDRRAWSRWSN